MEGWKKDKLTNLISQITTGKLDANAMIPNGKYRFYTCAKDYYYIDNYAFDDEALLISGNGEYVGYIHYYKGKFNAYQRVYVLTGFKIDVRYLENFLNRYLPSRINKEVSQNNIPYIRLSTLSKMEINYPESPTEQASIANILSKVDEAIESVKKSIEAAEKLRKSLMQNLLTGRMKPDGTLRTEDEFYEDEKFGKVPKGWEVGRFKKFSILQRGSDLTDKEVVSGIYPVVKSNGISIYHNQYFVKPPGVVTGRSGTIGKAFYIEDNFWAHNTTLYVKDFKNNVPKYIFYLILSMNFERYYAGTTVPTLNRNDIHKLKVMIPKISEEQQKIVSILDAINKIIKDKKDKVYALERLKKSLMQNLLTGKVRVWEDVK
ncbi:MAG: restriction endonuclease subunit S [Bacteroidales bacterium]|nr:restriction endonuclease subunit S [Bacteroidales bacterium]